MNARQRTSLQIRKHLIGWLVRLYDSGSSSQPPRPAMLDER